MSFNCHCHIFNFHTINTRRTREVLVQRLLRMGCPEFLREPMELVVRLALGEAVGSVAQGPTDLAVALLMAALQAHGGRVGDRAGTLLERLGGVPRPVTALLARAGMRSLLERRWRVAVAPGEVYEASLRDLFAFLEVMLAPSVLAVAEELLAVGGADVLVPLAMDIADEEDDDETGRARYAAQLDGILEVVRTHPGRALPFVAFSGQRTGGAEQALERIEAGGFVGLKLYPALEDRWPPPALRELLVRCAALGAPVMAHCMEDGFHTHPERGQHSHPRHWRPWLADPELSDLVICLGHFGGDTPLRRPLDLDPPWPPEDEGGPWPEYVLALMREFPGRVFADLAFHTKPYAWTLSGTCGPDLLACKQTWADRYFEQLRAIVAHPVYGPQVLWGTDYSMTRALVEERAYVELFRQRLGPMAFGTISEHNPRRFLGMAAAGGAVAECRANLQRHVGWLDAEVGEAERREALGQRWGLVG